MEDSGDHVNGQGSIWWLTVAAWLSLIVFAGTSATTAVCLENIGRDFEVGFARRGALPLARAGVLAAFTFVFGYLADRVGQRWLLGTAMFVVSLALLGMAGSTSYRALVSWVLVLGAGLGGLEALASPLTADLHPDRVDTHMNVLHGFFPLGLVLTSIFVGLALEYGAHWCVPFLVISVPAFVVALMFLTGTYPSRRPCETHGPLSVAAILGMPMFWLLAVVMMFTAGTEGSLLFWGPSFIRTEYDASALVGASGMTTFGTAMAAGRFTTGLAARFVGLPRLMVGLCLFCAAVTLSLAIVDSLPASLLFLTLAGVGVASFWPSILAIATRRIAAGSATLLAMLSVAGIVGFGVIPWLVGLLGDRFGLRAGLALLPAGLTVACVALIAALRRNGDGVARHHTE